MAELTEKGKMALGKLLRAEKEGALSDIDSEILNDLKEVVGIYKDDIGASDFGKAALQTVGEAASLPGRAGRALAVGAVNPKDFPASVKRGLDPNFAPKGGVERSAGMAGELAGDVASLAAGGAVVKAPRLAGPLYRLLRGGAEGATLLGAKEAAKEGDPTATAKASLAGGAGGSATSGAAEVAGLGIRAMGNFLKGKASSGVGEAVLSKAGKAADALRGSRGSSGRVGKAASRLISKAEAARKNAGEAVGVIRKALGLPNRLETAIDDFLATGGKSADSLAKSVAKRAKAPVPANPNQALQHLDALKHDLDSLISWNKVKAVSEGASKAAPLDEAALIALREKASDEMSKLPLTGVKALAEAGRNFSNKADAYGVLFGKVKTQGTAEDLLKLLARSTKSDTGRVTDVREALKELGATRIATSGATEAAANILKTATPESGVFASLMQGLGPTGKAKVFKTGRVAETAGKLLPGSKLPVAASKMITDALSKQRRKK